MIEVVDARLNDEEVMVKAEATKPPKRQKKSEARAEAAAEPDMVSRSLLTLR